MDYYFTAYAGIAPFIIRIILGITLAWFGYVKIAGHGTSSGSNTKAYGIIELIIATCLIVGFYTELAVCINIIILLIKIGVKAKERKLFSDGVNYYILLLAMLVSLLFSGPGSFAFDTKVHDLDIAHSTFENYFKFRGCMQLLEKTATYGTCKVASGDTIKIVLIDGKWYLEGDGPGIW